MDLVDQAGQEDQQQSDREPQGDLEDLEVPVGQVDPEVPEDQEVRVVQQRNLESPLKQPQNPQVYLVAQAVLVVQGVQEVLEVQEGLGDPGDLEDLMVLQLLPLGNQEDLEALEDQVALEDPVDLEVQKQLHLVNREALEDRVVPEVQGALGDPVGLEVQDVLCAQGRKQRQRVAQQNLEVPSRQLESLASQFHQVT